jgi:methyltransferase (TIGR00027 family)
MRPDRPSLTASLVAAIRALYTELPEPYRLAEDPLAARLVPFPLALPARAVARARIAAPALHRGLGIATLGLSYHVALRTRAIDDAVRDAVARGAAQLVVLGAGLDCRAMRMEELAGVRAFEVDHPSTQRYKVERIARARATVRARSLARVAVDFERDELGDHLAAAGFRTEEPAIWVWEGVTAYLTREAIEATLRAVAALSAPGSRVALTYAPGDDLPGWLMTIGAAMLRGVGEPIRTLLAPEAMSELLERAGLRVRADGGTADWATSYWASQRGVRTVERLAIAERM